MRGSAVGVRKYQFLFLQTGRAQKVLHRKLFDKDGFLEEVDQTFRHASVLEHKDNTDFVVEPKRAKDFSV